MPDYDFLDGYGFVNNMSPFANDPYIWDRDTYDVIVKNVVISEGITRVENGFFCLKSLKTVRLPDSLKSIGNGAFYACNNLESIRMPASVTSIGTLAFAYCTSLETVNILRLRFNRRYAYSGGFDEERRKIKSPHRFRCHKNKPLYCVKHEIQRFLLLYYIVSPSMKDGVFQFSYIKL
ncbi:MAG: leucine-rich repeat domain-containing protein [Ruminococcus sp.]|nr:leucine-rich repeat domain-containing protein [Ruminococcus sp.]